MKTRRSLMLGGMVLLAALLSFTFTPNMIQAQPTAPTAIPGSSNEALAGNEALAVAPGAFPIQGRLTDANGKPLNGTYAVIFRLYESETSLTAICQDNLSVTVKNGLFNTYMDHCYGGLLNGQKVWLGVKVGTDPEMTPRLVIFPVPYALGLVPGAEINSSNHDPLHLTTSNPTGSALEANATSLTGKNYGVYGASSSPDGYGGYFYNNSGGTGVFGLSLAGPGVFAGSLGTALIASSATGAAISARGTGIITSSAKSTLWISGNGVRPFLSSDLTHIDMDTVGGAKVFRGATGGNKNVMLPITVPGQLYGQNVKISAVDIYWAGDSSFEGIAAVLLRRQAGVCETATCFVSLINDHPVGGLSCEDGVNPTGCVQHYALTTDNELSANSGILYLTLELAYGGDTWVEIGGVRLTLEHD